MMEHEDGADGRAAQAAKPTYRSKDRGHSFREDRGSWDRTSRTGRNYTSMPFALFEVKGPGSKEFPEKKQYALAVFKGRPKGRQYEWWVESVKFPYKPQTFGACEAR